MKKSELIEGVHFYYEEKNEVKYKVFTELYLLNRNYCCNNSCRHCPYKSMKKENSLEKFMSIVEEQFPQIKKYIISKNYHHIVIEDPDGHSVFGSNKDLFPIFEVPCSLPIKKISITHKEKDCCFIITIDLK